MSGWPNPNQPTGYGGWSGYQPPPPPVRPVALKRAIMLMYVAMAVSLVGLVVNLVLGVGDQPTGSFAGHRLGEQSADTTTFTVATAIFSAAISLGLWIWMAWANTKGLSWARIVATVFGGIQLFSLAVSLILIGTGVLDVPRSGLSIATSVVSLVLVVAILWLMWQPESSRFYEASSQPQPAYPYPYPYPPQH